MTTALIERITSVPIVYDINAEEITTLCADFRELKIAGVEDKNGYKRVHEARMQLKRMRVAIEKRRTELKADALEYGRRCDSLAKTLVGLIEPTEDVLHEMQKKIDDEQGRIKREAEEARRLKFKSRVDALTETGCRFDVLAVQSMSDEEFTVHLEAMQDAAQHRRDVEAAELAERQRQEAEAAEVRKVIEARIAAEREEKRKADEDRLAAERAELKRQAAEYDARRREQEDKFRAERAEFEKEKLRVKAAQIEAARLEAEHAERDLAKADVPETVEREASPEAVTEPAYRDPEGIEDDATEWANMINDHATQYRHEDRIEFIEAVIDELREEVAELKEEAAAV